MIMYINTHSKFSCINKPGPNTHQYALKPTQLLTQPIMNKDTHEPLNLHNVINICMHTWKQAGRHNTHRLTRVEKEPCPRFSRKNLMLQLWSSWPLSRLHKSLTGQHAQPCRDNISLGGLQTHLYLVTFVLNAYVFPY